MYLRRVVPLVLIVCSCGGDAPIAVPTEVVAEPQPEAEVLALVLEPRLISIADIAALAEEPQVPPVDPASVDALASGYAQVAQAVDTEQGAAVELSSSAPMAEARPRRSAHRKGHARKAERSRALPMMKSVQLPSGTSYELPAELSMDVEARRPLGRDLVLAQTRGAVGQLRQCYEHALKDSPELRGRVLLSWEILADGSVRGAHIKRATVHDADLGDCLVSTVEDWTFPQGTDTQQVDFPFVLRPQ